MTICQKCGHWHGGVSSEPNHPCTHYIEALKAECGCTEPIHVTDISKPQAEVEQLRRWQTIHSKILTDIATAIDPVGPIDAKDILPCIIADREVRQERDTLRQRCEALEAACKLARPFVEACDWPAHDPMNDQPPFRVQRKEALKAINSSLKGQK